MKKVFKRMLRERVEKKIGEKEGKEPTGQLSEACEVG